MTTRIRTIKPEFFRHETLFDCEKEYQLPLRLAYIGLWTCCDREGRFRWRPRSLKCDILPYDDIDFANVLEALVESGFIVRYQQGDNVYGAILSWHHHQHVNTREAASTIPAPSLSENVEETPAKTKCATIQAIPFSYDSIYNHPFTAIGSGAYTMVYPTTVTLMINDEEFKHETPHTEKSISTQFTKALKEKDGLMTIPITMGSSNKILSSADSDTMSYSSTPINTTLFHGIGDNENVGELIEDVSDRKGNDSHDPLMKHPLDPIALSPSALSQQEDDHSEGEHVLQETLLSCRATHESQQPASMVSQVMTEQTPVMTDTDMTLTKANRFQPLVIMDTMTNTNRATTKKTVDPNVLVKDLYQDWKKRQFEIEEDNRRVTKTNDVHSSHRGDEGDVNKMINNEHFREDMAHETSHANATDESDEASLLSFSRHSSIVEREEPRAHELPLVDDLSPQFSSTVPIEKRYGKPLSLGDLFLEGGSQLVEKPYERQPDPFRRNNQYSSKEQEASFIATMDHSTDIPIPPETAKVIHNFSTQSRQEQITYIFECWKKLTQHREAKLDHKRKYLIESALKKGYSVEALCTAIEGCCKTPFNTGDNERGQRYDGLHIILRDADQIDRFIHNCHNPPKRVVHDGWTTAKQNVETWLQPKKYSQEITYGSQ